MRDSTWEENPNWRDLLEASPGDIVHLKLIDSLAWSKWNNWRFSIKTFIVRWTDETENIKKEKEKHYDDYQRSI